MLDPANHVCTTLVGRDVSPRGMLVETHPSLVPGQRVRVAVHTGAGREPIVLEAKVARNDGARGLVMRFVQMRDTHTEALVALVAALSPVEAVRSRQPIHHGNSAA